MFCNVFTRAARYRCNYGVALGAMAILATMVGAAGAAEEKIGNTALVHNTVERVVSSPGPIATGDDVFTDENVHTGEASAAKFVFSDETNLALGATSTVKLDRFVYKGPVSYTKAAINFAAGAFRFTTGASEKRAYQLKTNTATIGVRGTIFDVLVQGSETTITLVEGDIAVCPRKEFDGDPRTLSRAQMAHFHCVELNRPNQTAVVSPRRAALSATPFDFASNFCSEGGSLCSTTTTASLQQTGGIMCFAKPDND